MVVAVAPLFWDCVCCWRARRNKPCDGTKHNQTGIRKKPVSHLLCNEASLCWNKLLVVLGDATPTLIPRYKTRGWATTNKQWTVKWLYPSACTWIHASRFVYPYGLANSFFVLNSSFLLNHHKQGWQGDNTFDTMVSLFVKFVHSYIGSFSFLCLFVCVLVCARVSFSFPPSPSSFHFPSPFRSSF